MQCRKARSGGLDSSGIRSSADGELVFCTVGAEVRAVRWWSGMFVDGVGTVSVRSSGQTFPSSTVGDFRIASGRVSVAGFTWLLLIFRYLRVSVVD